MRILRDEDGQAVVEYILAVGAAVVFTTIIASGFRRVVVSLWGRFARDITAACPGCPPDPNLKTQ